ncbi:MAG: hypothetical protein FWG84_09000 [Bacteroidales bacterium]|nr:hypothetical protein [Bacteroidales bacterium]
MNLEQYIKENRSAFDNQEPADGHFERFAAKLGKPRGLTFRTRRFWWVAAAVLAGMMIGTGFFVHYLNQASDNCPLSSEVETVCEHYEEIMNQEIEHLKVLLENVEPAVRTKVLADVENMKSDTKELLKQFCDGVNDEQVLSVIKMNYEMKIKSIQFISSVVEESSNPPLT